MSVFDPRASGDDTITVLGYTAAGVLDTSWGTAGVVRTNLNKQGSGFEAAHGITMLPNGRIVVAGASWPTFPGGQILAAVVIYRP